MELKVKKLRPEAVIPSYAKDGDAAMDLTATWKENHNSYTEYGTDLAVAIPKGYVGLIFPRSSISNMNQLLSNHVGVIDSGYRGEIKFRFKSFANMDENQSFYKVGDRIGQLIIMPIPYVNVQLVDELDNTARGTGGFGSSGS